ncbi:NAD(P)/FAD-dependent oxidoreductase [Leifsonia sp. F6_8S_P_1A]|uniref:Pyridine nucleotide-disulfide oxidoreductase domain-containing protein 2 n=1 Tax=Leifsonia virtsii TaxID=3035915 RepID=A0ABT8IYF5_9MICO|nr:NAD(P)/FAD-dependent oxidoreductase [Leifsonia virtsii]MDN4597859.1 NAD(P)/FAD-dependent oxidoreductase [Leifsonia virtsii]
MGAGPNGLAAAITLARSGLEVAVYDAADRPGGAVRSVPSPSGALIDVGSSVYPFLPTSRFFREWRAGERVDLITPGISYAHPLDGGDAVVAYRDLARTAEALGSDGAHWARRFGGLARAADELADLALIPFGGSLPRPPSVARAGVAITGALLDARRSASRGSRSAALFAGVAAHGAAPLTGPAAASIGTTLAALAHAGGWPLPRGGAQALTDAMVADLEAHGVSFHLGHRVGSRAELRASRVLLLDTSPGDAARILGVAPDATRRILHARTPGPAVFKMDFVLRSPVPWLHADVRDAPTVHVGGSAAEVRAAEETVARGGVPDRPFVMVVQPTVVDPERAPGRHVVWAYTRLPHGLRDIDMSQAIIRQIERFAPGFRDTISELLVTTPDDLHAQNPNLVGGDILGGSTARLRFVRRPTWSGRPWRVDSDGAYLCSSAVAPGPGVHGMVGYLAAADALQSFFRRGVPPLAH